MTRPTDEGRTALVRPIDEGQEVVCLTSEDFEEIKKEMERDNDRLDADTATAK